MLYTIPDYYHEFHCLADACEDTCCAGWQIVIDKKSLAGYRRESGDFRTRLLHGVDFKESVFRQSEDGRCAFLNERNLCDMQLALGEKSLCKTCRRYPRHIEEFENVREITLSLSCPEVARMLTEKKEKVKLLSYEKEGEEEYEDFDPFLYSELVEARRVIRLILQSRKLPVFVRCGLMLGLAHDMQVRINRSELFSCEEVFVKYQKQAAVDYVKKKISAKLSDDTAYYKWAVHMYQKLYELEQLSADWGMHLRETEELLFANGAEAFGKLQQAFESWLLQNLPDYEILLEQILVYFTDTYFCGAVYDGKVYAKARMAVDSVFFLYEMLLARWKKNGNCLDEEDIRMMVYRYSRELEHSDENLERMEKFHVYRNGRRTL